MDQAVVMFFNSFAGKSWALDTFVSLIVRSDVIRGGLMVALFTSVWYWGSDGKSIDENRKKLVITLAGTIIALAISRLLVAVLPFRARPINDPTLHFVTPFSMSPDIIHDETTFPSDHAALFFALTTGIFMVSRRLGLVSLVIAIFVVSIPRLYLGLHYPSDIIAGAALGVVTVLLTKLALLRSRLPGLVSSWARLQPSLFFPILFLISFEMASTFDDTRNIAQFVLHFIGK